MHGLGAWARLEDRGWPGGGSPGGCDDALGTLLARLASRAGATIALACCHAIERRADLAARMGRELVSLGREVLLMDADHLEPELHAHFAVSAAPGLAQVLSGAAALEDAVREVEPGLWLLPAGHRRASTTPLAGGESAAEVLASAGHRYSAVVVVTPPLFSAEAGLAACRGADSVLLALPKGVARKEEVARAAELVLESGSTLAGAVIVP